MCTTNVYTYIHSDGRKETVRQPSLCHNSHRGKPCADNVVFQLPSEFVGAASAPAGVSYLSSHLPPTPSYTPRTSTPRSSTPNRSGDESDRSHQSGSSSRSKRRSSGIYVSVNGQKVVDLNHRERRGHERIVLVDSPPTPRTPPQSYTLPRTAPSSPSVPYIVDAPSPRASSSRRPVIVDERPRVNIELVDPAASSRHVRHSSTSSRDSRHSRRSSHTDEEERQRRREHRQEERRREEQELREQKLRARIAKANKEINSRPAAPMPPPPPRRSATFTRPVVEVTDPNAELAEAVRRMHIEDARRIEREEEAQRQRLLERMQPKRRATVGPGTRRARVAYDNGVYRYE